MTKRKLDEPDNTLTTQLFCRNVRRENKMWTYLSSQQTWNKIFLKDLCLGLLSDIIWWSLLWWPGHSWFQDQHSHCQDSKEEHVLVFQLSLYPDIQMQTILINPPKPVKRVGVGLRTKLCFPLCCCCTRAMTALKEPTKSWGMAVFYSNKAPQ